MCHRLIPATLAALAALAIAGAASADVSLVEAGIVCPEIRDAVERQEAPDTETGFIDIIDEAIVFDSPTRDVPLIPHLSMGLRVASDSDEVLVADIVVEHPPFGAAEVSRESWETVIEPGGTTIGLFSFDFPYEMVAGPWVFAVEVDGERFVEVSFNVGVDPAAVDAVCVGMMSV